MFRTVLIAGVPLTVAVSPIVSVRVKGCTAVNVVLVPEHVAVKPFTVIVPDVAHSAEVRVRKLMGINANC